MGREEGKVDDASVLLTTGKIQWIVEIILEVTEKHLKDNWVTSHSQHGFRWVKSSLTKLISFYDKMTHLIDQGKSVDVIC